MCVKIPLVISNKVLLRLSTTPFCCGVYGAVKCRCIPDTSQNSLNSELVNSPPLSFLRVFYSCPSFLFNYCLESLELLESFSLLFQQNRPHITRVIVYEDEYIPASPCVLLPAVDGVIGPHSSPCTSSRTEDAR